MPVSGDVPNIQEKYVIDRQDSNWTYAALELRKYTKGLGRWSGMAIVT